jgi:TolA-binding protein
MKYARLFIILLIAASSSCSRKSAQQLYQEGNAAQVQGDFALAVERFQEVVGHYPASAYAETSQCALAVMYNNDLHDPHKAIEAYQKLYAMFPSSSQAPNALFLVGFLYNNQLNNADSARMAYETFLQKFPTHELALSARFELQNLGKDPAAVLQSQKTSASAAPLESGAAKQ